MTARTYNIDGKAAANANSAGKRITETGPYVGKIRFAFYEKNEKGTESVHLLFRADNGQEAGPLALYTHNSQGVALPSYDMFNAILCCAKVKTISPKASHVELYDYNSQTMVSKSKEVYPELADKPVGLFLRLEEYQANNGEIKQRLIIDGAFDPATKLMANEIMARATEPASYRIKSDWLAKNPVKRMKNKPMASAQANQGGYSSPPPTDADFVDDDIPF
jgi:hypothetical protein